ncbi:hypothetical protein K435DRAFT_821207 [Dendrothele bispora CBS 962.96]|uniref:Uncharacterized protein n=1 Tax=Dendrothele bispora (strain CBS 962.96) TaxID=1314807 RepID=A0A4S8LMC9_DENBC|nr:hypothetical protein K435DRAFT_821207 [Dendrothele bispora CBS 962.96]
MRRSAPYEKSKSLSSGESIVARPKLKGINGTAPPGLGNLQLLLFNKEYLVSASHQLALITSLPFVHTALRPPDWLWRAGNGTLSLKSWSNSVI